MEEKEEVTDIDCENENENKICEPTTVDDNRIALDFKKFVNPTNIEDGHCAMCAFNTYLGLQLRRTPEAAFEPGSLKFKIFGDWFYSNFGIESERPNKGLIAIVNNRENQDLNMFKEQVANIINININKDDVVLLCIDDGTHWYTAFKRGTNDIVFIDAQKGIGFNAYSSGLPKDTNIEIIKIPDEIIKEYFEKIYPQNKNGGKRKQSKKKRWSRKRKQSKKKRRSKKKNSKKN